jgi:signal peptidase I
MSEETPPTAAEPTPTEATPTEPTPAPATPRKGNPFWRELPFLVVVALGLALLIKSFFVQAFYIPSASMENTLQGGNPHGVGATDGHPYDRVLVNKLVYDFRDPHRGEIVVFKGPPRWPNETEFTTPSNPVARFFHDIGSVIGLAPASDSDFIKRVIGVGGDTITCKHDVLAVNGHVLHETYLYPHSHPCSGDAFEGRTVHVPQGQVFVMGDHRDDSEDSRVNGPVPVGNVIGRAFVVIWPASDWKTLPIPSAFAEAGLAIASSGNLVLLLLLVAIVALAVGAYAVIRHRRRRASAYAAPDG